MQHGTVAQNGHVSKRELSWDEFAIGAFSHSTPEQAEAIAPEHLKRAVVVVAETMNQPPFNTAPEKKLECAMTLVLEGKVVAHADGMFTVHGTSDSYEIGDQCSCHAAQFGKTRYCKHLTAVVLWKRVQEYLYAPTATAADVATDNVGEEVPPMAAVTSETPTHHEAPYSLNVKVRKRGFEFQLTIRKNTAAEYYKALDAMPDWLESHGYEALGQAATVQPATAQPDSDTSAACPLHGTKHLKPSKKHGGVYCATKLDGETWCKFKA